MNSVALIGRLTRDPEVRQTQNGTVVGRFSIAVDRDKEGSDFPNIVCFGKTAELVGRYLGKGRLVGISGRLQTGSYEKQDGTKVFTTDVVAFNVQFLDKAQENNGFGNQQNHGFGQTENFSPNNQANQQNYGFGQFGKQGFQTDYQQAMNGQQQTMNKGMAFEEIDSDIPF